MGMIYIVKELLFFFRKIIQRECFCVTRSIMPGNAKTFRRGTSNDKDSHALFLYIKPTMRVRWY